MLYSRRVRAVVLDIFLIYDTSTLVVVVSFVCLGFSSPVISCFPGTRVEGIRVQFLECLGVADDLCSSFHHSGTNYLV